MLRSARALFLLFSAALVFCQTPAAPPAFDVAELKANKSSDPNASADFGKGGQVMVHNVPLKYLISAGFHIRAEELQGAPGWTETERFDIVAKAPPTTSEDDLRRMLITLLQDRLKLATHTEQKVMPVYALVVGKNGPKSLKESTPARPADDRCNGVPAPTPGDRAFNCQHTTMADLAEHLQGAVRGYIQIPVVDQTGIKGSYDFLLSFTPAGRLTGGGGRGGDNEQKSTAPMGSGLSIFDALQAQLGLKLESRKIPMPIVVVDHVERTPTEN